ncbi:hypothetical protein IJG44_04760 [bacterium]|nr:hypothetical protein [bacterium]MBQ4438398.1 hypothetical protein [bacterium]
MSKLAKTFFGRKEYRIDPKGRISLSADYYSKLNLSDENDTIVIACSPYKNERYLEIFSEDQWEAQQNIIDRMEEGPVKQYFIRKYIGTAEAIQLDSQNRVRLPKYMIDFAGIDKDVVFVGAINNIRIWSKEQLDNYENTEGDISQDDVFKVMNSAKDKMAENGGRE